MLGRDPNALKRHASCGVAVYLLEAKIHLFGLKIADAHQKMEGERGGCAFTLSTAGTNVEKSATPSPRQAAVPYHIISANSCGVIHNDVCTATISSDVNS